MSSHTMEQVLEAVAGSYGIPMLIATRLGITRRELYAYMARWPEVADAVEDERPKIRDLAEAKLVEAIKKGSLRAIQIALGTMGGLWDRMEVVEDGNTSGGGGEDDDDETGDD